MASGRRSAARARPPLSSRIRRAARTPAPPVGRSARPSSRPKPRNSGLSPPGIRWTSSGGEARRHPAEDGRDLARRVVLREDLLVEPVPVLLRQVLLHQRHAVALLVGEVGAEQRRGAARCVASAGRGCSRHRYPRRGSRGRRGDRQQGVDAGVLGLAGPRGQRGRRRARRGAATARHPRRGGACAAPCRRRRSGGRGVPSAPVGRRHRGHGSAKASRSRRKARCMRYMARCRPGPRARRPGRRAAAAERWRAVAVMLLILIL